MQNEKTTHEVLPAPIITSDETDVLNQTRVILKRIERESLDRLSYIESGDLSFFDSYSYGRIAETCYAAEVSVVNVMCTIASHLRDEDVRAKLRSVTP